MKRILSHLTIAVLCAGAFCSCQKSEGPAEMSVNVESIEVPFGGETTTIGVKCNRDWKATVDADWISLTPSQAEAFEASSYMILAVEPNNFGTPRSATINIASLNGEVSQIVKVTQLENSEIIVTAEKFIEYLNKVIAQEATNGFRLGADIDLSGKTLPAVAEMAYTFDGCNYAIKGWTSSTSMFGKIVAGGVVKNLKIEGAKLTFPTDAGNYGFIANTCAGTIENVSVSGEASMPGAANGYRGIICGEVTGAVKGCTNNVSFSYDGAPHAGGSLYIGGVIGRTNGASAVLSLSVNNGNLSYTANGTLTQSIYLAGVTGAANSNAKTLDCTNNGSVTVKVPGSNTNCHAAGIICYAGGEIARCANTGAISVYAESADGKADGGVKGTGVAGIADYSGWSNGTMTGCSNSGAITLRAGYTIGYQTVGSASKYSSNVAGIAAHMYNCKVDDCHNSGAVTSQFGCIDKCPSDGYNTTARQSIGGVISSSWGEIKNCTNKGKVTAIWVTSTNTNLAKNFVCQGGGINGGDYHSTQIVGNCIDCTNEGEISITCDSSGSNNAFGGISGWPGKEAATGTTMTGCVNKGNITVDGHNKCRVGGVVGGAAGLVNCTNYGKVYYKGGLTNSAVGGVGGLANFINYTGVANYGDVVSDVKISGTSSSCVGVGGLVGGAGNTEMTFSDITVKCNVTCTGCTSMAMIVGSIGHNKSGAKKFVLGTADKPIKISGSFNGTTLSASNYETYIVSGVYDKQYTNVTFNVKYGE